LQGTATRCGLAHLLHRQRPLLFVFHLNAVPTSSLYWPWPWRPSREECRGQRQRLCGFPLQGIAHSPLSSLDPRVEHLRLGLTELIRSPTLAPWPAPPPPTSPPVHMSLFLSSFLPLPKLAPYPSKPSGKNTVKEVRFGRPDATTTPHKLVTRACRDDGRRKGAYAYEGCDERCRGAVREE